MSWLKNDPSIRTLSRWIADSRHLVFFGGAGVSTESGIPDFRSAGGLYSRGGKAAPPDEVPPEVILSAEFLQHYPERFFAYFRKNLVYASARPNAAHLLLAQLEEAGKLKAVITQNIDGLHQQAGSRKVIELHGSIHRNICNRCARTLCLEDAQDLMDWTGVPRCECGGMIRPDVVLYGEMLPEDALLAADQAIRQADVLLVGGTSLSVYPAAGLVERYTGNKFILINEGATSSDDRADLRIQGRIGEVLSKVRF